MQFIIDVISDMQDDLNEEQLGKLKMVLVNRLADYDLDKKTTDIAIPCDVVNEEYLKKFFAWKSTEGLSDKTLQQYMFMFKKLLSKVHKPIPEITESDLLLYIASIKQQGVSKSYMRNIRQSLSVIFNWFYKRELIENNPMENIGPIKTDKVIKEAFNDVQLENMRNCISNSRDRAIFEVLLTTGARVSELTSMNIDDIDFISKSVKILGKGNKERIVYMSNIAEMYLTNYLNTRLDNNPALFVSLRKPYDRLDPAAVQRVLKLIGQSCNISKVHPHRFRRTLATNLLNKGMPLEEVSKILGHEKLETTMIYCNVSDVSVHNDYARIMN